MRAREQLTAPTSPSVAHDAAEAERERRLQVLHELAQQAQLLERPATSAAPAPTGAEPEAPLPTGTGPSLSPNRQALWRRATRQRVTRIFGVLGLLALVAVALIGAQVVHPFARTTTQPNATGPLAISLAASGIGCPADATWSPGSRRIAVIGRPSCNQGANTLAVFDATNGTLAQKINLDALVDQAVAQNLGEPGVQNYVSFEHVLWSQTGRIAVPFTATPIRIGNYTVNQALVGLIVSDANVASVQSFATLEPLDTPPYYDVWDLTSDALTVNPDAIASAQPGNEYTFATLYPALQYDWGFSGDLFVAQPLPNPGDPNATTTQEAVPVGSPTNGGSFSMWQFGSITVQRAGSGPEFAVWNSSFGAWSPDGSRIVDSLALTALLQPIGQPPVDESVLADTQLANMPIVAVRDAAMQAVVAQLQGSPPSSGGGTQLAWRPDGKALAVESESAQSSLSSTGHDVTLYDCSNGKVLATLTPPTAKSGSASGGWPVRWSASGKQLLLYDPLLNAIVVWGSDMLPK